MEGIIYKTFAYFLEGTWVIITNFIFYPETNYISVKGNESVPIEDYGDYFLSTKLNLREEEYIKF